jgi:hypothetical protein
MPLSPVGARKLDGVKIARLSTGRAESGSLQRPLRSDFQGWKRDCGGALAIRDQGEKPSTARVVRVHGACLARLPARCCRPETYKVRKYTQVVILFTVQSYMRENPPDYELICEPPGERYMIFDSRSNEPANVHGLPMIGLSRPDAEWIVKQLQAGTVPSRKYLQALESIARRRYR